MQDDARGAIGGVRGDAASRGASSPIAGHVFDVRAPREVRLDADSRTPQMHAIVSIIRLMHTPLPC